MMLLSEINKNETYYGLFLRCRTLDVCMYLPVLGMGVGSGGSLTPPPANLAGLGIFGAAAQRFSGTPMADRAAAAAAAAAFGGPQAALAAAAAAAVAGRGTTNGTQLNVGSAGVNFFGTSGSIFNEGVGTPSNKTRHNSIDKAASNRSKLLEDFR